MRRAKILATLGPASREPAQLDALLRAGVDAFRLNFSHGSPEQHRETATRVRDAARRAGRHVAILGDLSGPKIRCGTFASGPVLLVEGAPFTLTTRAVPGDVQCVSCTYPLARDLHVGDTLLLDDGLLRLRATAVHGDDVDTVVEVGGELSDRKGINVPGAKLSTPALTAKDKADAVLAHELGVDWLALSFVRRPEDLVEARTVTGDIPLVAKIEKPEAVANLEAIIDASDGIMVARGDLGVEMGPEKVPMVQKRAIKLTNDRGKLVITATQMLDSMIRSPRPTRAEAADVANAVLDGTDVLMLSGETASGKYPVESVQMMDTIVREVEASELYCCQAEPAPATLRWDFAGACGLAAALTSRAASLAGIVVFSRSGHTANMVAEYRPRVPVLAVATDVRVAQRLALQWGLFPVVGDFAGSPNEAITLGEKLACEQLHACKGAALAIVHGSQRDTGTKALILHTVR